MKIITNNKLYIQKKDLDLIIKTVDLKKIPNNIINKYEESINKEDIDFILFEEKIEIDYINSFWFIINYNDLIDFSELEITDFLSKDLNKLRKMRIEYEKNKYIKQKKEYTNVCDAFIEELNYIFYIPNKIESKKYPLDFQLLYNKVSDILELKCFKTGHSKLELPDEIIKPIYYSKKQLQKIYNEILSENLTFKELKPYEKQLYSIFSKINYTPDILEIIRKIILINKHNTIDFIDDGLLEILLHIEGHKTKFEESTMFLIDYLYAIGYNQFDNFESKIVLEKDLKLIKKILIFISDSKSKIEDKYIEKLSKYNHILSQIIYVLKQCEYKKSNPKFINDIFLNILVYIYFKPNKINYDYDFLIYVYNYLVDNSDEIISYIRYDITNKDGNFIKNFNKANNLMIYLYKEKNNNTKNKKLIKQKNIC